MRIRPVLLALGLGSLALAACGGDDGDAAASATTAAPAAAAPTTTAAKASAGATTTGAVGGDEYGSPSTAAGATAATGATGVTGAATSVAAAPSPLGTILVDGAGMTLYLFEKDTAGTSTCSGGCAASWPPLLTKGGETAGAGVDAAKLGTVARDDGTQQVTYAGKPLYYFAGDAAAGDTNGQGVNDVWFVLDPSGTKIAG